MLFVVRVQFHIFEQVIIKVCILLIRQQVLALISVEYFNRHNDSFLSGVNLYVLVHRVVLSCLYLSEATLNES
ncbi:hypothetical protein GCM10008014_59930 [Paenibacillus silvae]|uniref:Uncharacterized protein n=1 Tax=Paenibacillus silvae TaxID=1325358 RepID=A0ABQ1ZS11_9BACL|nr:hypothetical protein GCM10008014_59930 [Paenibacillus silvae]